MARTTEPACAEPRQPEPVEAEPCDTRPFLIDPRRQSQAGTNNSLQLLRGRATSGIRLNQSPYNQPPQQPDLAESEPWVKRTFLTEPRRRSVCTSLQATIYCCNLPSAISVLPIVCDLLLCNLPSVSPHKPVSSNLLLQPAFCNRSPANCVRSLTRQPAINFSAQACKQRSTTTTGFCNFSQFVQAT